VSVFIIAGHRHTTFRLGRHVLHTSFSLAARAFRRGAAAVFGAVVSAEGTQAQSAQPYSAQLAVLFTTIRVGTTSVAGTGIEPQFRFNRLYATEGFGALSLGIGGQYAVHTRGNDRLRIGGVFLEPRWVPATGSSRLFPYLSARLALLQMNGRFQFAEGGNSGGSGLGIGAGLAVKLSRTANFDAGAQLVRQEFGTIGTVTFLPFTSYAAKAGISLGFPK